MVSSQRNAPDHSGVIRGASGLPSSGTRNYTKGQAGPHPSRRTAPPFARTVRRPDRPTDVNILFGDWPRAVRFEDAGQQVLLLPVDKLPAAYSWTCITTRHHATVWPDAMPVRDLRALVTILAGRAGVVIVLRPGIERHGAIIVKGDGCDDWHRQQRDAEQQRDQAAMLVELDLLRSLSPSARRAHGKTTPERWKPSIRKLWRCGQ